MSDSTVSPLVLELNCWIGILPYLSLRDIFKLMSCSHQLYDKYTSQEVWNRIHTVHKIRFSELPPSYRHLRPPAEDLKKLRTAVHWRFNMWEASNAAKVIDHSGNKFHLDLIGAEYLHDGVGVAFTSNHYAEVRSPPSEVLDASYKFTVEAWVKPDMKNTRKPEYEYPIVSKHGPGNGWELRFSHQPSFLVTPGPYHGHFEVKPTKPILLEDRWYHVAGVYGGGSIQVYVDSKLVAERKGRFGNTMQHSNYPLTVGRNPAWTNRNHFTGTIQEVRICHRALRPDQFLKWQ